jgi:hypothetical protein
MYLYLQFCLLKFEAQPKGVLSILDILAIGRSPSITKELAEPMGLGAEAGWIKEAENRDSHQFLCSNC